MGMQWGCGGVEGYLIDTHSQRRGVAGIGVLAGVIVHVYLQLSHQSVAEVPSLAVLCKAQC